MGRLLIVRHGETPWNIEGRLQGHANIALSEVGRQQARLVARRLSQVPIGVAYSSDLSRASATAEEILDQREVPLLLTPEMRERHYGVFEGMTVEERKAFDSKMFAASVEKDLDFAPTGGETPRQTYARMSAFVAGILQRHMEETVLLVGHGGSLRAAIIAVMRLPLESTWSFVMANCGLSVFDTYPDNAVLRLYNDTSHLNGLGSSF